MSEIIELRKSVPVVADPLRIGKYGIIGALVGVRRDENPTSGDTKVMTAIEVKCRSFIFQSCLLQRSHLLMPAQVVVSFPAGFTAVLMPSIDSWISSTLSARLKITTSSIMPVK
jgi:hypothetical protein